MSLSLLPLALMGASPVHKALIDFFSELKRTHYKGRVYTDETLDKVKQAKSLGIDLKGLEIYPIGL